VNALATRLGHLQAQAVRINALGQRLVEVAKLDKAEFNFAAPPAQGGPQAEVELLQEIDTPNFMQSLDQLAAEMDSREQQLRVLESFFMNRSLDAQILPTGRPIQGGWISSYFGMRTDPFTGRREYHKGIDFAGKEGTEIQAVAAGLVTWSAEDCRCCPSPLNGKFLLRRNERAKRLRANQPSGSVCARHAPFRRAVDRRHGAAPGQDRRDAHR
jgi:murein DD-endopeptidase MepM/ murein hydrolase activator NlpD